MTTHHNKYMALGFGPILREAGVVSSNLATPTNIHKFHDLVLCPAA